MATITVPGMQELLSAGVHFGHQVRRGHPKMKPYIFGVRDGVHIIDLAQSEEKLKIATQAAFDFGKAGKSLLIVGTKKQAKDIVESLAKEVDVPYLNVKWVGGFLTNFEEVRKNIKRLNDLKSKQDKGELSHFTKKEQLLISKKLTKFEAELGGIAQMDKLPDVIFVVDAVNASTAVREANLMSIPLIGLTDTNADPSLFDFPVPANDDGIKSIKLICQTIIKAYGEGKKNVESKDTKETKETKVTEEVKEELPTPVAEEAAIIEEIVEKKIVEGK